MIGITKESPSGYNSGAVLHSNLWDAMNQASIAPYVQEGPLLKTLHMMDRLKVHLTEVTEELRELEFEPTGTQLVLVDKMAYDIGKQLYDICYKHHLKDPYFAAFAEEDNGAIALVFQVSGFARITALVAPQGQVQIRPILKVPASFS